MSRTISKVVLSSLVLGMVLAACSTGSSDTTIAVTTSVAPTTATTEPPATVPPTTEATSTVPQTVPATSVPPTTVASPDVVEVVVANGTVEGPGQIEAALGDQIEFVVISDVADEVHVHGYDIFEDVGPGEPASFAFLADIPGIFEVELEGANTLLVELVVQ